MLLAPSEKPPYLPRGTESEVSEGFGSRSRGGGETTHLNSLTQTLFFRLWGKDRFRLSSAQLLSGPVDLPLPDNLGVGLDQVV